MGLKKDTFISVRNLSRIYGGKVQTRALVNVSMNIRKGEFAAIMGRSGAGKSTLLHQLSLIDEPTEGKIIIDGVNVLGLSDKEKAAYRLHNMGYIFQEYALIAELTAMENVFLPALAGASAHDGHLEKAQKLLEIVELSDRAHHYPHELSGGEQQRVAIARSLINNPKVLFADEPTANLDTASSKIILELFKKLNRELDQTILMVTHEDEDKKYVDTVIVLRDGKIVKVE